MPVLTRKRKAELERTGQPQKKQCLSSVPTQATGDEIDFRETSRPTKRTIVRPRRSKKQANATGSSSMSAIPAAHIADADVQVPQLSRAANTASDFVFSTTEVLEAILLHMTPKHVILAQRVCTHFRNTLLGSPQLQKHLFLRPQAKSSGLRWASESSGLYDKSPRLFELSQGSIPEPSEDGKNVRLLTPVRLNSIMRILPGRHGSSNARISRYLHEEVLPTVYTELRKEESWHQMYICDPPPTKARIDLRWIIKTGINGSVTREVEDHKGITFAMLLDAALNQRSDGRAARGYWTDAKTKGTYNDITLDDLLNELEKKYNRKTRLVPSMSCIIKLYDMVAPTEAEWNSVDKAHVQDVVQQAEGVATLC